MPYYVIVAPVYKIHLRMRLSRRFQGKLSSVSVESSKIYYKMYIRTFYPAMCVVKDYKHNSYLTIDYMKYDFVTNKSLFLEKKKKFWGALLI